MTPLSTESTIARATAACAGPNICTACLAPLMVTLLNRMVFGLAARLGATTASSDVKPSLLLVKALQNAISAALPRGPMIRSMWATSLPSPTSDSPTITLLIFAIRTPPLPVDRCCNERVGKEAHALVEDKTPALVHYYILRLMLLPAPIPS